MSGTRTYLIASGEWSDYSIHNVLAGPVVSLRQMADEFKATKEGEAWRTEEDWERAHYDDDRRFHSEFTEWLISSRGFRRVDVKEWHIQSYGNESLEEGDIEEQ